MATTTSSSSSCKQLLLLLLVLLACSRCNLAARHGRKHTEPQPSAAFVIGSIHSSSSSKVEATTSAGPELASVTLASSASAPPCAAHRGESQLCGQKGIFFPPIPLVPEPPNIGGVPIPPNPITPAPPPLVPPIFPAPSPPSILPPLVPQPPPSSIIPPLLPPLIPNPPPPPPPRLLPPLLPPLVPGVPPASVSAARNNRAPVKP